MRRIRLKPEDLAKARELADLRNSKEGTVADHKVARDKDPWQVNYEGVIGELAVAMHFGGALNEDFLLGGDAGLSDLVLPHLGAVEVKTCTFFKAELSELKFNSLDEFDDPSAILVNWVPGSLYLTVCGVISRRKFERVMQVKNYGYGDKYMCGTNDLSDLDDVIAFISGEQA